VISRALPRIGKPWDTTGSVPEYIAARLARAECFGFHANWLDSMEEQAEEKFDPKRILTCLHEVESELFRIADTDECQRFHKDTQLTAMVLLLMRMSSLIRSLLLLLESGTFDGFDPVLRAFEETFYLAHELRLRASVDKAAGWLRGDKDTWSGKIGVLVEFAKKRGHPGPNTGRDYGLLSELAHPTRTAANNSVTLCGVRRGIDGASAELAEAEKNNPERIRYALYRLIWLLSDGDETFVKIPVDLKRMPEAENFVQNYDHIAPGT
jgi:hypothetical protein